MMAGLALLALATTARADYSEHPRAQALIDDMVVRYGMDRAGLEANLRQADRLPQVLESMTKAAEKTKTWPEYRAHFLREERIAAGVRFRALYRDALDRAEQRYGVPPEMIVAILGVETNYGSFTGRTSVLDALATLAFEHPTRGDFFTSELEQYLLLVHERGWQAEALTGSYAGAMGFSQFMPSNYRTLAVDFDGDGTVDLNDPVDAIGSVANYFRHHGWRPGDAVTLQLRAGAGHDASRVAADLKPESTVGAIAAAGFTAPVALPPDTPAALIVMDGGDLADEYWLGLQNFYVISRYNPRSKYALAVYLLSEEIRARA